MSTGLGSKITWMLAVTFSVAALANAPAILPTHHLLMPAATTQSSQQAIPNATDQQNSLALIQNIFKADYGDATPHGRSVLAKKLLQQAMSTNDDPAGKFELLAQAADAAILGGEPQILTRAIDGMGKEYAVDPVAMKTRGYAIIASACWTPIQAQQLADGCLAGIEQAIAADEYANASQLQIIGIGAANRSGQMEESRRFEQLRPELLDLREQFSAAKSALDHLQAHPDDAHAAAVAGKFLCFVKCDWNAGLPVLAHADNAKLSDAAKSDLSAGQDSRAVAHAADNWWDISVKFPPLERQNIQTYAASEYRRVLPALDGLSKTIASQRITEFDNALIQAMHLAPGLCAQLFEDKDFSQPDSARTDEQINFEWGHQPPAPSMPKEDYAIRWTGKLHIAQPGLYTLALQANEGAKLLLDGKPLLEAATGAHRHTTQKIDLQLQAGLHDFQLDYWAGSGMAKCKLMWIAPGSLALVPIPGDVFYHDGGQGDP